MRWRAWHAIGMVAGLLAVGAHAESTGAPEADPWIHGIFTGKSPRAVVTDEKDAWQRANRIAASTPDAFVLVGSGRSMQPLYTSGTILVLRKTPYASLECGQTALYRNKDHHVVAHVLVARARDGWRVAGLNNLSHDMEPLQEDNLVGVVIAAFRPLPARNFVHLATLR
jgi:hypothetical protein